jgi:hypothetical protein
MVQVVVVCYALFNPLFVVVVLAGCGVVDDEVHFDKLSHERQCFLFDHFLDANCVCSLIKLATTLAFPCSLFFHTTNRLHDFYFLHLPQKIKEGRQGPKTFVKYLNKDTTTSVQNNHFQLQMVLNTFELKRLVHWGCNFSIL